MGLRVGSNWWVWVSLASVVAVLAAGPAHAKRKRGPTQVVPEKKKKRARASDDLSAGGERRGVTEFVLGSVAAGAVVAVVGRGIWELGVGRKTKRDCASGVSDDIACERPNPGNGGVVAAGLSFALVVPFSVASGLLFSRGVKTQRAYKRWHKHHGTVRITTGARRAGISISLRF